MATNDTMKGSVVDEVLGKERIATGEAAAAATGIPEYKSAADFDARFTQMLAAEEEAERKKQEQKIERQKVAQSMSDLGAVFGDVIKASGGAVVTPREVKAQYDAMDKNAQTVYDNYRTRMDVLRKGIKDRADADKDAAMKAKENANNWYNQYRLYEKKEEEAKRKSDLEYARKVELLNQRFAQQKSLLGVKSETSNKNKPAYVFEFKNKNRYRYDKATAMSVITTLFDRMIDFGLINLQDPEIITPDEDLEGALWKDNGDGTATFTPTTRDNISTDEKYLIIQRVINMANDEVAKKIEGWVKDGAVGHRYKDEEYDEKGASIANETAVSAAKSADSHRPATSTGGLYGSR